MLCDAAKCGPAAELAPWRLARGSVRRVRDGGVRTKPDHSARRNDSIRALLPARSRARSSCIRALRLLEALAGAVHLWAVARSHRPRSAALARPRRRRRVARGAQGCGRPPTRGATILSGRARPDERACPPSSHCDRPQPERRGSGPARSRRRQDAARRELRRHLPERLASLRRFVRGRRGQRLHELSRRLFDLHARLLRVTSERTWPKGRAPCAHPRG